MSRLAAKIALKGARAAGNEVRPALPACVDPREAGDAPKFARMCPPILPFYDCMARPADGREVSQVVRFLVCGEGLVWLDVVNAQVAGGAAPLACSSIPLAGDTGLTIPVGASVVHPAPKPRRALVARGVTGSGLPTSSALGATEVMGTDPGRNLENLLSAEVAEDLDARHGLDVGVSSGTVGKSPLCLTGTGTVGVSELLRPRQLPLSFLPTPCALDGDLQGSGRVPASHRAKWLLRVVPGRQEFHPAMPAGTHHTLGLGHVEAGDRAVADLPVRSLSNRVPADSAWFHADIIPHTASYGKVDVQ
jgi:hypothetical protein